MNKCQFVSTIATYVNKAHIYMPPSSEFQA